MITVSNYLTNIIHSPIKSEEDKFVVNIRGVEAMNNNPEKVRILYGKVMSEPLQKMANSIAKQFIDSGLHIIFKQLNIL